jgi:hypothetical protein
MGTGRFEKNYWKLFWIFEVRWWWLEVSTIKWIAERRNPARSSIHDHNRWERTMVIWGKIIEKRYHPETDTWIERTYFAGEGFWVPAGTRHEVRCEDGYAKTRNIVFGRLRMNTWTTFEEASASTKQKTAASL